MWVYFLSLFVAVAEAAEGKKELILIAAPSKHNSYYEDRFAEIINFQISYAKLIAGRNEVIVLADRDTLPYLTGNRPDVITDQLPLKHVMESNVDDIWIRDFGTIRQTSPVILGYSPGYLKRRTAKRTKDSFLEFLKSTGIRINEQSIADPLPLENPKKSELSLIYFSDLIVDGGNVVDNMQTTAILTDRALYENQQYKGDKESLISALRKALGYPNITIISQYGNMKEDTTGHSDGMVSFLDTDTVAYSQMDKDKQDKMVSELKAGLGPKAKFVELPSYFFDEKDYHGFNSACGLHINSLVTKDYVYMPVFGHDPEAQAKGYTVANDDLVFDIIQKNTRKQVIKVPVPYKVCILGGSVRCLSMQIEGSIADHLISLAAEKRKK